MNPKFRVYIKSISIDDINYDDEFPQSCLGNIYPVLALEWDRKSISIEAKEVYHPDLFDWNDNAIVMQYTGLNDKNGQEIYEGDILTIPILSPPEHTKPLIVEFQHGAFCVKAPWSEVKPLWEYRFSIHNFEVIGNIHQHPVLARLLQTDEKSDSE